MVCGGDVTAVFGAGAGTAIVFDAGPSAARGDVGVAGGCGASGRGCVAFRSVGLTGCCSCGGVVGRAAEAASCDRAISGGSTAAPAGGTGDAPRPSGTRPWGATAASAPGVAFVGSAVATCGVVFDQNLKPVTASVSITDAVTAAQIQERDRAGAAAVAVDLRVAAGVTTVRLVAATSEPDSRSRRMRRSSASMSDAC